MRVGEPLVGVVMGSQSDWETMRHAAAVLDGLQVAYEARVVSAHRTPDRLRDYATGARARGLRCIVAGAGGAALESFAHLFRCRIFSQLARLLDQIIG